MAFKCLICFSLSPVPCTCHSGKGLICWNGLERTTYSSVPVLSTPSLFPFLLSILSVLYYISSFLLHIFTHLICFSSAPIPSTSTHTIFMSSSLILISSPILILISFAPFRLCMARSRPDQPQPHSLPLGQIPAGTQSSCVVMPPLMWL